MYHCVCLGKMHRLSTHMTIFQIIFFWPKLAKLVETQKNNQHRLNHSFLHHASRSALRILIFVLVNILKLAFYRLFGGFLIEKYRWPPRIGTETIVVSWVITYREMLRKYVSIFFEKIQNFQNEGVLVVAVREWSKCMNCKSEWRWVTFGY